MVTTSSAMPVPERYTLHEAAAIPEVFLTVFLNVFQIGGLEKGGALLAQGGGSGIGTAAIQLAKAIGATVVTTVGSEEKAEKARALGADHVINYREERFETLARRLTSLVSHIQTATQDDPFGWRHEIPIT